ncbi:MAG: DUF4160 domain-containing protein [Betaproteobacteria bacterium]|nr:DUF4160 domain-containing protein [Betaproteobacteria bacterium]
MPTLFLVGPYRVMVFINDHGPAHVHAIGANGHARFRLGSVPENVMLMETRGIPVASLRRIAVAIMDRHNECRKNREKHHGKQSTNRQGR